MHADGVLHEMSRLVNAISVRLIRAGMDLSLNLSDVLALSAQSAGMANLLMKTAAALNVRRKFAGTVICLCKLIHASVQAVPIVSHAGTVVLESTRTVLAQMSQLSAQSRLVQVVNQETLMTALVSLITRVGLFPHAEMATPSTTIRVNVKQATKSLLMAQIFR